MDDDDESADEGGFKALSPRKSKTGEWEKASFTTRECESEVSSIGHVDAGKAKKRKSDRRRVKSVELGTTGLVEIHHPLPLIIHSPLYHKAPISSTHPLVWIV